MAARKTTNNNGRRRPLTEAERKAAAALRARWLAIPKRERPTQQKIAEQWGEGGSQSLISQYMQGDIPLNIAAAMRFAAVFRCRPEEILDVPELSGRPIPPPLVVIPHPSIVWPFRVQRERFDRLQKWQKDEIQGVVRKMIEDFERGANIGSAEPP